MKALSVRQPYATLIMLGIKPIETRTKHFSHRGDLLICAAKQDADWTMVDKAAIEQAKRMGVDFNNLPRGVAMCVVNVTDCRPMQDDEWSRAACKPYPGAKGLHMTNVREVEHVPITGMQGIFEVPDNLIAVLAESE